MKVLITGGNGYLATAIKNRLSDTHDVTSVTRKDFDISNTHETTKWFSDKHFDVVIHTAIQGGRRTKADEYSVTDTNIKMYLNLLDNKQYFDRFISIGSGAELYQTNTPYGLSKHVIRQSMLEKDGFYNVRVFAVFDENELDNRFIKANVTRYIKKEPMLIFQDKKMDFFYMNDFVDIMKYYVENINPPKEIDCTYEQSFYLKEIAQHINKLSNYEVPIKIESPDIATEYVGNHTPIGLSYVGLSNGIQRVYNQLSCRT